MNSGGFPWIRISGVLGEPSVAYDKIATRVHGHGGIQQMGAVRPAGGNRRHLDRTAHGGLGGEEGRAGQEDQGEQAREGLHEVS